MPRVSTAPDPAHEPRMPSDPLDASRPAALWRPLLLVLTVGAVVVATKIVDPRIDS